MSIKAHEQQQQYSPPFEHFEQQFHGNSTPDDMQDDAEVEKRVTMTLQSEIQELKRALSEKENQLLECLQETDRQVELEDSIIAWQDKYERLYESHKRVQKVNQNLEDKLLKLVERGESKNAQLTSDVATLSVRLAQANYNISLLQREIERYKTDMGLAIQLLQCKPDGVVAHKISTHLPIDLQNKLRSTYMRLDSTSHSDSEGSVHSGGGILSSNAYTAIPFRSDSPGSNALTPLPSTGVPKRNDQISISPSVMVKFLEDELKASQTRHCESCKCPNRDFTVVADIQKSYTVATQTIQTDSNLCIRCSNDLNSPSHVNSSPFAMKLVKSSDSVISETKSSVSDSTQNEKLFSPAKKDSQDLTINPILGHHRLCDRATHNSDFMPSMLVSPKLTHISSSSSSVSKKSPGNAVRKLDVVPSDSYESHENMSKLPGDKFDDLLHLSEPATNESGANDTDNDDLLCNEKTYLLDKTSPPPPIYRNKSNSSNVASRMILRTPELTNVTSRNTNNGKNPSTTSPAGPSSCSTAGKNSTESYAIHDTDKAKSDSLRGAGNGSTNSLWSRTSSRDGFKMFESFNRNLIKTIKAENPKMKGPRICALRIQTGSNNIMIDDGLEDNLEIPSPIVYTRRPRLLDEELDDEKDVTLAYDCKISMVMSDVQKKPIILNEKFRDETEIPLYDTKAQVNKAQENKSDNTAQSQQPSSNNNYGSYGRGTSQTDSEVDLKRQQLSRVAEWVQNNSKINDVDNFPNKNEQEGDLINLLDTQAPPTALDNKHLIYNRTTVPPSEVYPMNNNNNLITESGNSDQKSLLDTVNIPTESPKDPIIAQQPQQVTETFNKNSNSINLYKYFKLYASQQSDYEDDEDLQFDNGNDDDCCDVDDDYDEEETPSEKNLDDDNQIDLAQMEYNVKQFLLKQNEWSIHNKLAPGGARLATSTNNDTVKANPHRTETNL